MIGIFRDGKWYENTDLKCRKCGGKVYESDNPEYSYQCFNCDEDLYSFEVEAQDAHYHPRVKVARHVNGITLNGDIEYLLGEDEQPLVFDNPALAEGHLISHGIPADDLGFYYFIEVEDAEK